jgi:ferredoxin
MNIDEKALSSACIATPNNNENRGVTLANQLCRGGIKDFIRLAKDSNKLLVACTQEAPLFLETLDELDDDIASVRFTNIREKAGWSLDTNGKPQQQQNITAKMAALISEATLDIEDSHSVTMSSEGVLLVLGHDETALEAAKKLSSRLDVTVILELGTEAPSPRIREFPVFTGKIISADGHLGQFRVSIEDFSPVNPSSKANLKFDSQSQKGISEFDLILDLRVGATLFPSPERRDGYFNPDSRNPVLVADALFELTNLVGSFKKPRYINYEDSICAYSRATITGCTRCIDHCPTSAIKPAGEKIEIDPYICAGCGTCASICPTGAAHYNLPAGETLIKRLRTLLKTYLGAGGVSPYLLIHDLEFGEDIIDLIARNGKGLPSNIIPFSVNQVTQIGLDFLLAASAYGAERILILLPPHKNDESAILQKELDLAEVILDGLGYGKSHFKLIESIDPETIETFLYNLNKVAPMPNADFLPLGRKRSIMSLALGEIHKSAPSPVDTIELPNNAPFGTIEINTHGCTVCLACVGACPTGALHDNEEKPQLSFTERACVQCGLCKNTCPENVISLTPRLSFLASANEAIIIKEEEPFECIRCGKPFGAKSSIKKMVTKLENHPMFKEKGGTDRLKMCDECRVIALAEEEKHPLAFGARPKTRTTADYLKDREELRQKATNDMIAKGLVQNDTDGEA